ncbi:MAG: hypothetical protein ACNI27_07315 [Desulfovibrio sp.]
MTQEDFEKLWHRVHTAFSESPETPVRKLAKENVFHRIKHMPSGCVNFLIGRIEDLERLPKNLGRAFIGAYGEWCSRQPDQRSQTGGAGCNYCESGYLYGLPAGAHPRFGQVVFACPRCNSGNGFPLATVEQIRGQGLTVVDSRGQEVIGK